MYRPYESAERRRAGRGNRQAKAAGVAKLDLGTRSTSGPMAHTDSSSQRDNHRALLPFKGGSTPPASRCPRTLREPVVGADICATVARKGMGTEAKANRSSQR